MKKLILFSGLIWFSAFPVQADTLNETRAFFVDPTYDVSGRTQISATLRKISDNAYWYIEDAVWNALESTPLANHSAALNSLAAEFDYQIYPKLREIFGSEWNPGIDNDHRITVLFHDMKQDAGGYFSPNDEYPKERIIEGSSNEREMIYLNIKYLLNPRVKEFLAHEFQHLITFNQKVKIGGKDDDVWLNEARSEYTATYLGYEDNFIGSNLHKRKADFLAEPSDSLTEWRNEKADYANVNLFGQYLADRFGAAMMTKIIQSSKIGMESVNEALKTFNADHNFSRIFGDWLAAVFFNDCSLVESNRFCYQNPNLKDLRVSPTRTFSPTESAGIAFSQTIKNWAGNWHKFNQWPNVLKIEFSSQGENSRLRAFCLLSEFSGKIEIREAVFEPRSGGGEIGIIYLSNEPSQFTGVVCVPYNQYKTENFSDNDPTITISVRAEILSSQPVIFSPVIIPALPANPTATDISDVLTAAMRQALYIQANIHSPNALTLL
ncbi:MAG: hypothetical protein Q8L57_01425, partial [bacterium]|nr:hypothetical protein [bacterium]